jgi:hypothetical protein
MNLEKKLMNIKRNLKKFGFHTGIGPVHPPLFKAYLRSYLKNIFIMTTRSTKMLEFEILFVHIPYLNLLEHYHLLAIMLTQHKDLIIQQGLKHPIHQPDMQPSDIQIATILPMWMPPTSMLSLFAVLYFVQPFIKFFQLTNGSSSAIMDLKAIGNMDIFHQLKLFTMQFMMRLEDLVVIWHILTLLVSIQSSFFTMPMWIALLPFGRLVILKLGSLEIIILQVPLPLNIEKQLMRKQTLLHSVKLRILIGTRMTSGEYLIKCIKFIYSYTTIFFIILA